MNAQNQTIELRKQLRQKRQSLTPLQQIQHAQQALQHLTQIELFNQFRHIALFLSQDGELDTLPLIRQLWLNPQHKLYLPALETKPNLHMGFAPYSTTSIMKNNQFGIAEPACALENHFDGTQMDLVLMPLVGFDEQGNRLGMGGGYYDRTFEFKRLIPQSKPLLIGWAHECQKVAEISHQPWDIPLDGIITETGYRAFKRT